MAKMTITVNGKQHAVTATPDTPLLYVLRNDLRLQGPRFGCGLGQCGACSVLVGNTETRACITPVAGVAGKKITTLEGLPALWAQKKGVPVSAADKSLHPVQQAWIDEQVPMCGYCQNGMIIMAVHLLDRVKRPTEAQIIKAFTETGPSPHICRCGTYNSIMAAVKRASKVMA